MNINFERKIILLENRRVVPNRRSGLPLISLETYFSPFVV